MLGFEAIHYQCHRSGICVAFHIMVIVWRRTDFSGLCLNLEIGGKKVTGVIVH